MGFDCCCTRRSAFRSPHEPSPGEGQAGVFTVSEDWQPISSAPTGQDLRLSVIEGSEVHSLVFPCRLVGNSWASAINGAIVDVNPSHWQPWTAQD